MNDRIFESIEAGKLALKAFGEVPENFFLFEMALQGTYPNYHGIQVKGAEFIDKQRVAGTTRITYISNAELRKA